MKTKEDKNGNYIGDGSFHANYTTVDFSEYQQINTIISESATTESVYVTYQNTDNLMSVRVRFSNHDNNAVTFGDQLDGNICSKLEILYHLGLAERVFTPEMQLFIALRQVAKAKLAEYEEASLTIREMYALGANADLSEFTGKIAKGSNYLILGDKVMEEPKTRSNAFGQPAIIGNYSYTIKK